MERRNNNYVMRITVVGLMAALVFVGNYFQIQIPNGVLVTRIHLGNSMCLLAGLLFSGMVGGTASGIGAGLFDLLTPAYIISAPYTFISKFAMGFVAGKLNKKNQDGKIPISTTIIAAVLGQIVYIILYLVKTYFTILILGGTNEAAWAAVGANSITSGINAVLAVIIAVPLYVALTKALARTPVRQMLHENNEKKSYLNPVNVFLIAFAFVTAVIYSINLAATNKIQKAEDEKQAQLESRLEEYESKFDFIEKQFGIEFPKTEDETSAEE